MLLNNIISGQFKKEKIHMYSVRKIFRIPIGHRLMKHEGLCKNIHGHNLKIEVQLSCDRLNENDMIIDFKDLKSIVNNILEKFDHCTIFNRRDEENIKFFQKQGYKFGYVFLGDVDPTAEIISRSLFTLIKDTILEKTFVNKHGHSLLVDVDFVRVWENDDSMAEYKE